MLQDSKEFAGTMFSEELTESQVRAYKPPQGAQAIVPVSPGTDWVREVIQHLSGIQRKSKGHGQASQFVFHQCTEFVALYAGFAKSTVHLIVTPKRFLRTSEMSASQSPMVRRLAAYGSHLVKHLAVLHPDQRFAVGFRTRQGRVEQFHVHLLSMDLAAPRQEDLERRHFEDFTV